MKLFVYGTLKAGGALNKHLDGLVENRRVGVVAGDLYSTGWYPVLSPSPTGLVMGEVYDVKIGRASCRERV